VVFQLFVVSKKVVQVEGLACPQGGQYCDTLHDHTVSLMGDCVFLQSKNHIMNLHHCDNLRSHIGVTYLRFEVFIVVMLKIQAAWDVELCGRVVTMFERIVVLS
jgi:hypothetical protein